MARYQVLSWQELPALVKAEDASGEVEIELPLRFQERIDEIATERGATEADAYLAGWDWGEAIERDGTAQQVAEAVVAEIEARFP